MTSRSTKLLQEALALPPDERAEIADRLLSSLDTSADLEIDRLWAEEAEDRLEAFERGQIKAVPGKEVRDRIKYTTK